MSTMVVMNVVAAGRSSRISITTFFILYSKAAETPSKSALFLCCLALSRLHAVAETAQIRFDHQGIGSTIFSGLSLIAIIAIDCRRSDLNI